MNPKPVMTTGDVASHCHVSQETVSNWIRGGSLKAYKTPGRHRRIRLEDFSEFLIEHNMPPIGMAASYPVQRRVLVVDDDPAVVKLIVKMLGHKGPYARGVCA